MFIPRLRCNWTTQVLHPNCGFFTSLRGEFASKLLDRFVVTLRTTSLSVIVWLVVFLGAAFSTTKLLNFLGCDFRGFVLLTAAIRLRGFDLLEPVFIDFVCWLDHDVLQNHVIAGSAAN